MTLASHRQSRMAPDDMVARLRRYVIALLFLGSAAAAGALGIVLAAHIGPILLTAALGVLMWLLIAAVVDFFSSQ